MFLRLRIGFALPIAALVAGWLVLAASAHAAVTPPVLRAPAANADPVAEGGSVTFSWSGALQGDPDALGRSFFRVELIKASKQPAGAQAAWPEADLETFVPTEPGEAVDSVSLGVPSAGEYRWRVCAWGVVDDVAANQIQQLPGGCSASRSFTTVAASSGSGSIGELNVEERRQVPGRVTTVYVPRETEPQTTTALTDPGPQRGAETGEPEPPAQFQPVGAPGKGLRSGSALGLGGGGDEVLAADSAADRDGIAGAVFGGLGATMPLVPVPFWTLALLLACVPILVTWRRSVLAMFDWADGSLDGRGTMPDPLAALAFVPVARGVKNGSTTADADASAPRPAASHDAPEGGRQAA